jgi:hypothetical protein
MIEHEFCEAVSRYLGNEDWAIEDIQDRITVIEYPDGDQTVAVDECPVLRVYPAEMIDEHTARIPFEHLLPSTMVVH